MFFGLNEKPNILVSSFEVANVRTSQSKVVAIKNWPLPEMQKQVKSFAAFYSFLS